MPELNMAKVVYATSQPQYTLQLPNNNHLQTKKIMDQTPLDGCIEYNQTTYTKTCETQKNLQKTQWTQNQFQHEKNNSLYSHSLKKSNNNLPKLSTISPGYSSAMITDYNPYLILSTAIREQNDLSSRNVVTATDSPILCLQKEALPVYSPIICESLHTTAKHYPINVLSNKRTDYNIKIHHRKGHVREACSKKDSPSNTDNLLNDQSSMKYNAVIQRQKIVSYITHDLVPSSLQNKNYNSDTYEEFDHTLSNTPMLLKNNTLPLKKTKYRLFDYHDMLKDPTLIVGCVVPCPTIKHIIYKIKKVVQKAIYGAVVLAEEFDKKSNRTIRKVALKIMVKFLATSRQTVLEENICAEIEFWEDMKGHPNFLVYDHFWIDNDSLFIVMPYAEFHDLFEVLKNRSFPFNECEARWLFSQLLSATDYLHRKGIGFRDHSLENVLMMCNGQQQFVIPKITDPGQAIRFQFNQNNCIQELPTGPLFGKSFRPPEVYSKGTYNPVKVDVFCIGWMLFFTVTKCQLFDCAKESDQSWALCAKKRYDELLKQKGGNFISSSLKELLWKMLHPNPACRPTPEECLNDGWFKNTAIPITSNTILGVKSTPKLLENQIKDCHSTMQTTPITSIQKKVADTNNILKSSSIIYPSQQHNKHICSDSLISSLQSPDNNLCCHTKHYNVPNTSSSHDIKMECGNHILPKSYTYLPVSIDTHVRNKRINDKHIWNAIPPLHLSQINSSKKNINQHTIQNPTKSCLPDFKERLYNSDDFNYLQCIPSGHLLEKNKNQTLKTKLVEPLKNHSQQEMFLNTHLTHLPVTKSIIPDHFKRNIEPKNKDMQKLNDRRLSYHGMLHEYDIDNIQFPSILKSTNKTQYYSTIPRGLTPQEISLLTSDQLNLNRNRNSSIFVSDIACDGIRSKKKRKNVHSSIDKKPTDNEQSEIKTKSSLMHSHFNKLPLKNSLTYNNNKHCSKLTSRNNVQEFFSCRNARTSFHTQYY